MPDIVTRPFRPDDWRDLHAIASHWPVVRQLGGWPWPPQEAFSRSRSRPYEGDGFVWALERDGRIVGSMAVTGEELGYMLRPDVAGQGLATRIARRAVSHAFDTMGRDRLTAAVWHDNPASARILAKLGFVHWHTGFERGAVRYPSTTHRYRLSRDRWRDLSDGSRWTKPGINPERPCA